MTNATTQATPAPGRETIAARAARDAATALLAGAVIPFGLDREALCRALWWGGFGRADARRMARIAADNEAAAAPGSLPAPVGFLELAPERLAAIPGSGWDPAGYWGPAHLAATPAGWVLRAGFSA